MLSYRILDKHWFLLPTSFHALLSDSRQALVPLARKNCSLQVRSFAMAAAALFKLKLPSQSSVQELCCLQQRGCAGRVCFVGTSSLKAFTALAMAGDHGVATSAEPTLRHNASTSGSKQALLSLSNKANLEFLGRSLIDLGYTIISTGGTAEALEKASIAVQKVEELTDFPEMLDGRVKTLHPNIHGGILARREFNTHMEELKQWNIGTIDIVIVNLYPFYDTVTASKAVSFENGVEKIDIGGPAMIRAAAKNHKDVLVVVDPEDYGPLIEHLQEKGSTEDQLFRRRLAWKAFQHVASYDSAVAEWLWKQTSAGDFAPALTVPLSKSSSLRYGENPHQKAAFYVDRSLADVDRGGIATALQHHGKEMSYNNYLDADAAWNCVSEFSSPTCVIVKHTNPCGVASRENLIEAYKLAVEADPVSAFGGIVAFNVEVDEALHKGVYRDSGSFAWFDKKGSSFCMGEYSDYGIPEIEG
ncbi:hypothetical protein L7F22_002888 [Adiantum nelumboides]|nr:hypothetical protein [Adiantum nelumboides]